MVKSFKELRTRGLIYKTLDIKDDLGKKHISSYLWNLTSKQSLDLV